MERSNVINLVISSHEVTLVRHQLARTNELNMNISERVKSASPSLGRQFFWCVELEKGSESVAKYS